MERDCFLFSFYFTFISKVSNAGTALVMCSSPLILQYSIPAILLLIKQASFHPLSGNPKRSFTHSRIEIRLVHAITNHLLIVCNKEEFLIVLTNAFTISFHFHVKRRKTAALSIIPPIYFNLPSSVSINTRTSFSFFLSSYIIE